MTFGLAVILLLAAAMPLAVALRALRLTRMSRAESTGKCPVCGYDLRATKRRCPECGTPVFDGLPRHIPLRDDWPATSMVPRSPSADETPIVVHQAASSLEANLLQQQFEARGIECRITIDKIAGVYTGRTRRTASLVVWSGDIEQAKLILSKLLPERQEPAVQQANL